MNVHYKEMYGQFEIGTGSNIIINQGKLYVPILSSTVVRVHAQFCSCDKIFNLMHKPMFWVPLDLTNSLQKNMIATSDKRL